MRASRCSGLSCLRARALGHTGSVVAAMGPGAQAQQWWCPRLSCSTVLKKFLFMFNWRIIALQCWFHFCHTSTWISHRCTYVSSLLNLPIIGVKLETEKQISYINSYKWNLKIYIYIYIYIWSYLQSRKRDTHVENQHMDATGEGRVGRIGRLKVTYIPYWY